jgi:hypothetical protein
MPISPFTDFLLTFIAPCTIEQVYVHNKSSIGTSAWQPGRERAFSPLGKQKSPQPLFHEMCDRVGEKHLNSPPGAINCIPSFSGVRACQSVCCMSISDQHFHSSHSRCYDQIQERIEMDGMGWMDGWMDACMSRLMIYSTVQAKSSSPSFLPSSSIN